MVTIDGYVIDAFLTEAHSREAAVTKYPVESGGSITSNVKPQPARVTVEGCVSNTPIGHVAEVRARAVAPNDGDFDFLPADEARAKLEEIFEAAEPVVIETNLKRYESMVMTNLDMPIDDKTGGALYFTATFEYVKIITNLRTTVRVASPNLQAKTKRNGPPVVHVHNGPKKIVTRNGFDAEWNPSKGRYEYANDPTREHPPVGSPVPDYDLNDGLKTSGLPEANENSTYFDREADEWRNTDGTPVTRQQLQSKSGSVPTVGDNNPDMWYVPESGLVR